MTQASLNRIREAETAATQRIKEANLEASDRRKAAEAAAQALFQRLSSETDTEIERLTAEAELAVQAEVQPLLERGHNEVRHILQMDRSTLNAAVKWVVERVVT